VGTRVIRGLSPIRFNDSTIYDLTAAKLFVSIRGWKKVRFGEAAKTNTRAACAPQIRDIRVIRGLSQIRFNDSTIQRFNCGEAIRVHSPGTP
jgi:hypothetical protein